MRDAGRRLRHPRLRGGRDARVDAARAAGDPDALGEAVIALLGDEERRVEMGRAARAHALESYSWDDIARRLEEIYVEVTA